MSLNAQLEKKKKKWIQSALTSSYEPAQCLRDDVNSSPNGISSREGGR
jgi:hypothetical protein